MTHKNKKAALKAAFLFLYSVVFRFGFKINACAREGTGSAVFFQYFHNIKVNLLAGCQKAFGIAGFGVTYNKNVQAAVCIIAEVNHNRVAVNKFAVCKVGAYIFYKFLHLVMRCIVGNAQQKLNAAFFALGVGHGQLGFVTFHAGNPC